MKHCLILCLLLFIGGCASPDTPDTNPEATTQDTTTAEPSPARPQAPADGPDFSVAGLEKEEVGAFFRTLKEAAARDDRRKVASLVAYPLTVQLQGQPVTLKDAADFVARYPALMNAYVREAVAAAEMERLFVNWQGVRIGRGAIWFGGVSLDDQAEEHNYAIKIVAINPEAP